MILKNVEEQVLNSINYKSDALTIKSFKDPFVYITWKRRWDTACKNESIAFLKLIKLFKKSLLTFIRNLRTLAIDLGLICCFDLDVDSGVTFRKFNKISSDSRCCNTLI